MGPTSTCTTAFGAVRTTTTASTAATATAMSATSTAGAAAAAAVTNKKQLEDCARWLLSCTVEDVEDMQYGREFRDFLSAFERLNGARRNVHAWRRRQQQQKQQQQLQQQQAEASERGRDDDDRKGSSGIGAGDLRPESPSLGKTAAAAATTTTAPPSPPSPLHPSQNPEQEPVGYSGGVAGVGNRYNNTTRIQETSSLSPADPRKIIGGADGADGCCGVVVVVPQRVYCPFSFLQHGASDDVLLRAFEFLDSVPLARCMGTCARFREMALASATRRTKEMARECQLPNAVQLLRAKEQTFGGGGCAAAHEADDIMPASTATANAMTNATTNGSSIASIRRRRRPVLFHVPCPTLLLPHPVIVRNAGDADYNGVYYCTSMNGNGYVFTKPRTPPVYYVGGSGSGSGGSGTTSDIGGASTVAGSGAPSFDSDANNPMSSSSFLSSQQRRQQQQQLPPRQALRCIISKRFSEQTILWYMSKEVVATATGGSTASGVATEGPLASSSSTASPRPAPGGGVAATNNIVVTQRFSFWANLLLSGNAPSDICRYPSLSSILSRHNEGWQTFSNTRPPTVELLLSSD